MTLYPNDQGNPLGAIPVYGTKAVIFDPLTTLDASTPTSLFDAQLEYGLDTVIKYDAIAVGASSVYAAPSSNGGTVMSSGYVVAGQGQSALVAVNGTDYRHQLTLAQIDAYAATQDTYTLVATSMSATSTVAARQ